MLCCIVVMDGELSYESVELVIISEAFQRSGGARVRCCVLISMASVCQRTQRNQRGILNGLNGINGINGLNRLNRLNRTNGTTHRATLEPSGS